MDTLLVHVLFIVCIGLMLYATYGAFYKDFGKKHYEIIWNPLSLWFSSHKSLRVFVVIYRALMLFAQTAFRIFSPRSQRVYVIWYKAWVLFYLVLFTVAYFLLIINLPH